MHLLIIEDESRIARRLLRMATDYFADQLTHSAICDEIDEGITYLEQNEIDLLLLDLNLNGDSGFEVLQRMAAAPFHVIIVSAYHDKALQAFEYGVLDFVPKPFNAARLFQAFDRLGKRGVTATEAIKYLSIQKKGMLRLIPIKDLSFIQGAGIYTELFLSNGEKALHNKSLDKLANLLPDHFFRVHKSYLVDLQEIKQIQVGGGGKYLAILRGGQEIPIGRTKYKELKERIGA